MNPNQRFRLRFSAVAVGLIALTACGRKDEANAPIVSAPAVTAAAASSPGASLVAPEQTPAVTIQADPIATEGAVDLIATAVGDPNLTYKWYVDGGKIQDSDDGSSLKWTAGPMGYSHIYCAGTTPEGGKSIAMATVKVIQAPGIKRFDAVPATVTLGGNTELGWDAAGATKLTLDPGEEDVAQLKGPGKMEKPQKTTTYKLTASNDAGTVVSKTFTVKVIAPPAVKSFTSAGLVVVGQSITLVADFSGGHAEIRKGSVVLATSDRSPLEATTILKEGDSFTLIVTSETGTTATATRTFNTQRP